MPNSDWRSGVTGNEADEIIGWSGKKMKTYVTVQSILDETRRLGKHYRALENMLPFMSDAERRDLLNLIRDIRTDEREYSKIWRT